MVVVEILDEVVAIVDQPLEVVVEDVVVVSLVDHPAEVQAES